MSATRTVIRISLATIAASLFAAVPASADTLIAAAPAARNLTQGGDWLAWAAPAGGGKWRIVTRSPAGVVSQPSIPTFGAAPDPSIGSNQTAISGRKVLAVYSRCSGSSATAGCDVWGLDLAAGTERKLSGVSSAGCSETAPSIYAGGVAFVRRGGACSRPGVYHQQGPYLQVRRRGVKRVATAVALETGLNGSRIAYTYRAAGGAALVVRRISGEGTPVTLVSGSAEVPGSLIYGRYTAAWMLPSPNGMNVFTSSRISGNKLRGTPFRQGNRTLPASSGSISGEDGHPTRYLDAEGVKSMAPALF